MPSDEPPPGKPSSSGIFKCPNGKTIEIREVWAYNLEEEMKNIREAVMKYPYVAMDTEFPGVVTRPIGEYGASDTLYQTLKCNVDMLKLIQLGLAFSDKNGEWADACACWQFNFKFSLSDDIFAQDSIDLLVSSGIDFPLFQRHGVDPLHFGQEVMMSGLVLREEVKWLTFHSSYDFAYLLRLLTCEDLPSDESSFLELLHLYFPSLFDVKYMMATVEGLFGGLSTLADSLQVIRVGPTHQAGSDSLLTSQTFFALANKHLSGVDNVVGDENLSLLPPVFSGSATSSSGTSTSRFKGELFGLGSNHTKFRGKGGGSGIGVSVNGGGVGVGMVGGVGVGGMMNSSLNPYSVPPYGSPPLMRAYSAPSNLSPSSSPYHPPPPPPPTPY